MEAGVVQEGMGYGKIETDGAMKKCFLYGLVVAWCVCGVQKTAAAGRASWDNSVVRSDVGGVRMDSVGSEFRYNVDFATYFDNREYDGGGYQRAQTIFATRLSPEIGFELRDGAGGRHRMMAGVHYTQPLGGEWRDARVLPTAYYRFGIKGFAVALGAIPYGLRYEVMPEWLMYDSIAYARPNIQGALLSYGSRHGFVEMMCDWRGSRSAERREMFRLVLNGRYRYKWIELGGYGQINHKAGFDPPHEYEGVCDDIYVNPQVGADVTGYVPLDSLALRVGYILGVQRDREKGVGEMPQGVMVELYAAWWFVGVKNTFYYGENLMPYYGVYGADLNQGDPFYQSRLYNRTDVFVYLYRNNFVNCHFSWNFHYDAVRLQHQQQLTVRFSLDGFRGERKLRGLFDK